MLSALNRSGSLFGLANVSLQAEPILWISRGWSAADSFDEASPLPIGRACHTLHIPLDISLIWSALLRWPQHYPAPGGKEPCADSESGGKCVHLCSRGDRSFADLRGTCYTRPTSSPAGGHSAAS